MGLYAALFSKSRWIFLISCMITYYTIDAQVHIEAKASRDLISVGDTFMVIVKISADSEVLIQDINVDSLFSPNEEMEILNTSTWDTIQADHAFYLNRSFTCIAYDTGYFEFRSIGIDYKYDGQLAQQKSDPGGVHVIYQAKFEAEEAAPIRDIYRLDTPSYWWIWLIGVLIVMTLLVWWYRRRPKKEVIPEVGERVPIKDQKPPEEDALIELDMLQSQIEEDDYFYTQISMIIRRYLKERFDIPAPEMLTIDIIAGLNKAILKRSKSDLEFLLNSADYARYGQGKSIEEYKRFILAKAILFVQTMKKEIGI